MEPLSIEEHHHNYEGI
jgi:hypothetical protein